MRRRHYWSDYKTTEFAQIDPMKTIAILPTAAIEQHGPHLPVGVDTMINQGMLDTVCERLPEDMDVRILPIQAIGKSNEHLHAQGTLTLPADLTIRLWTEIGRSVARAGVRKLVFVNSHGGNVDIVSIVGRELRVEEKMLTAKCQWGNFNSTEGLFSKNEQAFGIHGGDVETSLMLHFRPDLVDMSKAENFRSTAEGNGEGAGLSPIGWPSYSWISSDLNPAGTVGEAHLASAEKGKVLAHQQADGFIDFLREVEAFDLERFD